MATVTLTPVPYFQGLDANGNPINGGKLFAYQAGTTIKQDTYTTAAGSTPNANPVILDSAGRASVFLDVSLSYKLVLAPANDTDPPVSPIWTQDNITAVPSSQTIIPTGLVVGFAGTVVNDVIQLGDADFRLSFTVDGTSPGLQFASGDYFFYNRASNFWEWDIASTREMKLGTTGLEIDNGLNVGFQAAPTSGRLAVGDTLFYLDLAIVADEPGMVYASGDYYVYNRTSNIFKWYIANTVEMMLDASGLQVTNGLVVGFAGTPGNDEIQLGDANFKLDWDSVNGFAILQFDTGDYMQYNRGGNDFKIFFGGANPVFYVDALVNTVLNSTASAIATNATNGFTFLPATTGTPTGTPAISVTGATAFIADPANNKLWLWNGAAWKSATFA